jgi:hypothetical protein
MLHTLIQENSECAFARFTAPMPRGTRQYILDLRERAIDAANNLQKEVKERSTHVVCSLDE